MHLILWAYHSKYPDSFGNVESTTCNEGERLVVDDSMRLFRSLQKLQWMWRKMLDERSRYTMHTYCSAKLFFSHGSVFMLNKHGFSKGRQIFSLVWLLEQSMVALKRIFRISCTDGNIFSRVNAWPAALWTTAFTLYAVAVRTPAGPYHLSHTPL